MIIIEEHQLWMEFIADCTHMHAHIHQFFAEYHIESTSYIIDK